MRYIFFRVRRKFGKTSLTFFFRLKWDACFRFPSILFFTVMIENICLRELGDKNLGFL